MRLRVGIIGIGKHGQRYAKHIREDVDELELVAVSRRDAGEGARSRVTSDATTSPIRGHSPSAKIWISS